MDFHERLKSLRSSRKCSQQAVADGIGTAKIVYQRYEKDRKPAYDQLLALADFFDVSLDYLVGRTDDPARPPAHRE